MGSKILIKSEPINVEMVKLEENKILKRLEKLAIKNSSQQKGMPNKSNMAAKTSRTIKMKEEISGNELYELYWNEYQNIKLTRPLH
jgi:hypothetical protein